jgi:hypothetical protein
LYDVKRYHLFCKPLQTPLGEDQHGLLPFSQLRLFRASTHPHSKDINSSIKAHSGAGDGTANLEVRTTGSGTEIKDFMTESKDSKTETSQKIDTTTTKLESSHEEMTKWFVEYARDREEAYKHYKEGGVNGISRK